MSHGVWKKMERVALKGRRHHVVTGEAAWLWVALSALAQIFAVASSFWSIAYLAGRTGLWTAVAIGSAAGVVFTVAATFASAALLVAISNRQDVRDRPAPLAADQESPLVIAYDRREIRFDVVLESEWRPGLEIVHRFSPGCRRAVAEAILQEYRR